MVLEWSCIGGRSLMFLEPLSKCSWRLFNVFFIMLHPITFISVHDFTFLKDVIFILGSHQEASDGFVSSNIHLYSMFVAYFLQTLIQPFGMRNNHIRSMAVYSFVSRVINTFQLLPAAHNACPGMENMYFHAELQQTDGVVDCHECSWVEVLCLLLDLS